MHLAETALTEFFEFADTADKLLVLRSSHGTLVGVDLVDRSVRCGEGTELVLLIGRQLANGTCVFVAADGLPFHLSLGLIQRTACLLQIETVPVDNGVGLKDLLLSMYLSSSPKGDVVVNRQHVLDWETYSLEAATDDLFDAGCRLRLSTLGDPKLGTGWLPPDLRDAIEDGAGRLVTDQLMHLVDQIEKDDRFTGWQSLLDDGDPWLAATEGGLENWLGDRARSHLASRDWLIENNSDFLATIAPEGQLISAGHVVSRLKRATVIPSRKCCIITTVRNEGPFLIDWIAFHLSLGVSRIFVYSNDNDDGSDELLNALDAAGFIVWIRNTTSSEAISPQYKAYGHAFGLLPDVLDYEWALVIDLDEYLVLDFSNFASLETYLDWHASRGATVIALTWLMFGPSKQKTWSDRPVPYRFVEQYANGVLPHLKCFVRPRYVSHAHCHFPWQCRLFEARWVDAAGCDVKAPHTNRTQTPESVAAQATFPTTIETNAWINHYWYKSAQEFIVRRSNSTGDKGVSSDPTIAPHLASYYLTAFYSEGIEDARISGLLPGMEKWREYILSDAQISRANIDVLDKLRETIAVKTAAGLAASDDAIHALGVIAKPD